MLPLLPWLLETAGGDDRAVVADGWVFVAGTTGYDYDSMTISEDVAEQADQCVTLLNAQGETAWVLGSVASGEGEPRVELDG